MPCHHAVGYNIPVSWLVIEPQKLNTTVTYSYVIEHPNIHTEMFDEYGHV